MREFVYYRSSHSESYERREVNEYKTRNRIKLFHCGVVISKEGYEEDFGGTGHKIYHPSTKCRIAYTINESQGVIEWLKRRYRIKYIRSITQKSEEDCITYI